MSDAERGDLRTSVGVVVIDSAVETSVADHEIAAELGPSDALIRLPGSRDGSDGRSARSIAVFAGGGWRHRWAHSVATIVGAAPGTATKGAVHTGDEVVTAGRMPAPDNAGAAEPTSDKPGPVERRPVELGATDMGPVVDRAVQLVDVAHDGQFVASESAASFLDRERPLGLELHDLGWHRLADLGPASRLWQVSAAGTAREFAALRTLDTFRHNLPITRTSLIGRAVEHEILDRLLTDAWCVTLTGSGGVGKSRLALSGAARGVGRYPGGVWWVELVGITDEKALGDVVRAVLAEAGAAPDADRVTGDPVAPTLLVLDNCEHVAEACAALVAELIDTHSAMTVLSTSREPLGLKGETVWRVPSLATPSELDVIDADRLRSCPSVRLFTDRARAHDLAFVVDDGNAAAVAQICTRLDGIPLAVELAAARCRQLGAAYVASELDDRFELLTDSFRDAHRRHRTLTASIDWSHDRLAARERVVFRRLGVFAGPFTVDVAAEVTVALGGISRREAVDDIGRLVDCSLVDTLETATGPRRYRLLESLRMYASSRADEAGELDQLRDAHVAWWLAWFGGVGEFPPSAAVVIVEALAENLQSALEWSARTPRTGLALLTVAARAWHGSSRSVDAVVAADRVLSDVNAIAEPEAWLDAAVVASVHYAFVRGDGAVQELAQRAALVAARLEDPYALAAARWIERSDDERSDWLCIQARRRGCGYVEALAALTSAEHVAQREPLAALSALSGESLVATCGSDYLRSWAELVRGRVARDVGDFAMCLGIADRLAVDRSAHMVFNAMILLVQAGLLAASRDALRTAIAVGTTPAATARMILEAGVARTHLGYLDGRAPSRVDPEFGREPMTPGSLWLCALEAIDAGHPELALTALATARPHGALLSAVESAVSAAAWDIERCYETMTLAGPLGLEPMVIDALETAAVQRAALGKWADSLRLVAAARKRRGEIGYHWQFPRTRVAVDAALARSAAALSADDAGSARDEGSELTLTEAVAYALRRRGRRGRPRLGWESLTPTELHVAKAMADGLTNRRIGEQMMISPTTVKSHVDHIFTKLGVHSRAEVAAGYVLRTPQS